MKQQKAIRNRFLILGCLILFFVVGKSVLAASISPDSILNAYKAYVTPKVVTPPSPASTITRPSQTNTYQIPANTASSSPVQYVAPSVRITNSQIISALRSLISSGNLPEDIKKELKGEQGPQGPQGPSGANGTSYTFSSSPPPIQNNAGAVGVMGGFASLGVQDLNTKIITVTGNSTLQGSLSVGGDTTITGLLSFSGVTNAGLKLKNLTTVERDAVTASTGLAFFNTTLSKMQVYNGTTWKNVGNPEIGGEVTGGTAGSALFVDVSGNLAQDNTNFFWDDTNNRLGIGTATPATTLDVNGVTTFRGNIIAGTDNTYDIGANGATRPRTLYLGTGATIPALTATTINGNTFTAGSGTLTLGASKTLTVSNSLTFAGTDGTTMTFPATSATIARTDAGNTFTGNQIVNGNITFTDNTYDIGASGATRPRTGYFGTSLISPYLIGGSSTTSDLFLQTTSGVGDSGADIHFLVGNAGGTEAMTILNSGNVGIGTTNPTNRFTITYDNTNKGFMTTTSDYANGSTGTQLIIRPGAATGDTYHYISSTITGGSAAGNLVLQPSGGNIGIGTTSPASRLDILSTGTFGAAGTSGINQLAHTVTLSGANPTTYATFYGSQIGAMTLVGTNASQTVTDAAGLVVSNPIKSTNVAITNTHGILIPTTAVSTATNAYGLTVNKPTGATFNYTAAFLGGNVGIGATNPSRLLEVTGNLTHSATGDAAQISINGTATPGKKLNLGFDTTSDYGFIESIYVSTQVRPLVFNPLGGSVGVGTTNPVTTFQLSGITSVGGTSEPTYDGDLALARTYDGPEALGGINFKNANSYGTKLYTNNTNKYFGIASRYNSATWTEHLVVKQQTGNVGIGTTNPDTKLHLYNTDDTAYLQKITSNTASGDNKFITFRTDTDTERGSITFNRGGSAVLYNQSSDQRLKENITSTHYGLSDLMNIEVKDFSFISDPTHTMTNGFIAQQLYTVYPMAVSVGGDDPIQHPWGVDYGRITPLVVKSIQDLNIKLDGVESRVSALEASVGANGSGISSLGDYAVAFFRDGVRSVVDGIAYMKGLVVDTLTVGNPNLPTAITVYDANGQAGCMTVVSVTTGVTSVIPGTCESQNVTPPATPPPAPSCTDGIQNQDETGVDTGGVCTPPPTPTCTDGIQNQDETGVDEGGVCTPPAPEEPPAENP